MADKKPDEKPDHSGTLRMHWEKTVTNYANFAVITSTPEEIILNFSLNLNPPQPGVPTEVDVSSRVIMTYPAAKRLALALGGVLQQYEAVHGTINAMPGAPPQRPPDQPRPRFG
jgi:hypothetical protein